jgi:hypothetical protein
MQPSSGPYWQCYLREALLQSGIPDRKDLATITVLDERWHFGEKNWDFAPGKIEYQLRRALKGLNYIVMIEFEVYRNVRYLGPPLPGSVATHHDYGRVIAPHIQGLIWGKRPSARQRAQFRGGLFGAPGIKIVQVYDFHGALQYMAKPPCRGKSVFCLSNGRMLRWPWSGMHLTLHHLLLRKLCWQSYPDLTFASGEGSTVLALAKRLWRDYEPDATGLGDYRPPLTAGLRKRFRR